MKERGLLTALAEQIADSFVGAYEKWCAAKVPRDSVLAAMAGALAACAAEAGATRESVVAALNSAFDEINCT